MEYLKDVVNRIGAIFNLPPLLTSHIQAKDLLWIHDTTAYGIEGGGYEGEFLASFFYRNSSEKIADGVSKVLTKCGMDPDDHKARHIIETRVEAFLNQIIIGRKVDIQIHIDGGGTLDMPVSGPSGISALTTKVPFGKPVKNGEIVLCKAILPPNWVQDPVSLVEMKAHVADPEGWAIISDIDDTIKISQVLSITDLLKNTFIVETPLPTPTSPEFYAKLSAKLNPCFIYLSASPYNLYPFLRSFIASHYPSGQIILRDSSWMDFLAVIQSVTMGTETYKTNEGTKVMGTWLTKRKFICIGDSTQSDPETYSNLYRKYPDRVKHIWIRVVSGVDEKEEAKKNAKERFDTAFKDVPSSVWRLFTRAEELNEELDRIQVV